MARALNVLGAKGSGPGWSFGELVWKIVVGDEVCRHECGTLRFIYG